MNDSKIYDIILVIDLKREVFSFLEIEDLLLLRCVNSIFHDSIDYDEIVWRALSRHFFGVDIISGEDGLEKEERISYRKMFVNLAKECTCTEYALKTRLPKDLFSNEKLKERNAVVSIKSRKYPFKTNLISPMEFQKMKVGNCEDIPSSSLIFEFIVRTKISEEQLKKLRVVCCYFCEIVFCSDDENSLAEDIHKRMISKYGVGSMDFLTVRERKEIETMNETKSYIETMMDYIKFSKEKAKKFDFSNLEDILSSDTINEVIEKQMKKERSLIHSVHLGYQPQRNRLYVYWNFSKFKDPIAKLFTRASKRIYVILPWYPIYQSMKKIFTFPSKLLKKKGKSRAKKLKMLEEGRKGKKKEELDEQNHKKKGKRKKKGMEFKMKWKTFLRNLEFRMLGDIGQDIQYDYSHVWFNSSVFYYARQYFGELESVIIRNDTNSQFVINFNDSFPVFDHALLVESAFPSSVISKTVEYLQNEKKEEMKLEEEWENELNERLKKEQN